MARLVKRHPKRFFGVMFVHAEKDIARLNELAREFIETAGFCAIKVRRHDAAITRPVCELAAHYRVPVVLYDVMGRIHEIDLFTEARGQDGRTRCTLISAHMRLKGCKNAPQSAFHCKELSVGRISDTLPQNE